MRDNEVQETEGSPGKIRDEPAVSSELRGLSLDAKPPLASPSQVRPPRPVTGGVISVDITEQFKAAASTLEPGELIKDPFFTLFESVGALEIMDPKMDSGCLPAEELEDDDYDFARLLLPEEVVGIIDQLLCLEMAWHLGYPLSQTIFTSAYIFAILSPVPSTISEVDFVRGRSPQELAASPAHVVLRAYCISLIKTCSHVIKSVKAQIYYEEEDLVTNTYHLSLLENVTQEDVRQVLLSAREAVLDHGNGWSKEASLALDARLEFRDAFLNAIELAEVRMQPDALQVPWKQMSAAMESIKKTHELGKSLPESFSVKLQRRLASTMPPRPIIQPSFSEACERWLRFCEDGNSVIDVLRYADPQSLLKFVFTFQAQKPQPLVFIRVLMQDLIFADNIMLGQMSIRKVMDDDLALIVLPSSMLLDPMNDEVEAVQDPRFAVAQYMEEFRQRAFPVYLDVFRTLCQNRSRARRMLCRAIQEWDKLQIDAEEIDALVQNAADGGRPGVGAAPQRLSAADALPLSSWVFLYKLQLMEWALQLGFELEVYLADELPGMYWYLSHLAKRRVQHVERIRTFTMRAIQDQQQQQQQQHRAGKKISTLSAAQSAAFKRSLAFLRTTLLDASASWELAEALSCFYSALQRTGEMPVPDRPFGSVEMRYELRMRPFIAGSPSEVPPFETFAAEVKQADSSVADMLTYAENAIGAAKKGLEALARLDEREEAFSAFCHSRWLARTKSMQKSAIFAGIAVATARKAAIGDGSWKARRLAVEVPTPDKCYHEWWVVPKITATPSTAS